MGITKFRVKSRRPNRTFQNFECHYYDTQMGIFKTLFKDGKVVNRAPLPIEVDNKSIMSVQLTAIEAVGENKYLFRDFEFYDKEDLGKLSKNEVEISLKNEALYNFISGGHSSFIINDEQGNNINKNAIANAPLELINLTEKIKSTEKFNRDLAEASIGLKTLSDKEEDFIEFCYAYGVPVNSNMTHSMLYNACAIKMQANPKHFLDMLYSKDRQIIALVNRALNAEIEDEKGSKYTPLVMRGDGMIFYEANPVAQGIDNTVEYFKAHDRERRALETKLGVRNSFTKGIKLMEESKIEKLQLETPEERVEAETAIDNEILLTKMRNDITKVFNTYKTREKRDEKIGLLREKYQDSLLMFDTLKENLDPDNQSHGIPTPHILADAFGESN